MRYTCAASKSEGIVAQGAVRRLREDVSRGPTSNTEVAVVQPDPTGAVVIRFQLV